MVAKYTDGTMEVEAIQYTEKNMEEVLNWTGGVKLSANSFALGCGGCSPIKLGRWIVKYPGCFAVMGNSDFLLKFTPVAEKVTERQLRVEALYELVVMGAFTTVVKMLDASPALAKACVEYRHPGSNRTFLHVAANSRRRTFCEKLIKLGVDVTIKDYSGRTAEAVADKNGYYDLALFIHQAEPKRFSAERLTDCWYTIDKSTGRSVGEWYFDHHCEVVCKGKAEHLCQLLNDLDSKAKRGK
jgi:hypothetical protein